MGANGALARADCRHGSSPYDPRVIDVPRELVWDYDEAPANEQWRLQRILDFFPHYGRDRATVQALAEQIGELRAPPEAKALVLLYAESYAITVGR